MAHWLAALPADRYQSERLYQADRVSLPGIGPLPPGDDVVLAAVGPAGPVIFGRARVVTAAADPPARSEPPRPSDVSPPAASVTVEYVQRLIDRPVPAAPLGYGSLVARAVVDGVVAVPSALYQRLVEGLGPVPDALAPSPEWMVSLSLPIEAASPAEAVRAFWGYVRSLGPRELPAFVWPRGDELAMRPYVLGVEHDMDPEEGD